MKSNIRIFLAIIAITVFGNSCTDDFLEVTPHNSATTDEALETIRDYRVAANGLYAMFKSGGYYGTYMSNIPAVLTDLVHATERFTNTYGEMHQYNFHPGTPEIVNIWAGAYTIIANANLILNSAGDFQATTEEDALMLENIKGEAYCARAIAYFDLIRTYADTYRDATAASTPGVPIVLASGNPTPARNSVLEVYQQIINDFNEAINYLQNENVPGSNYFNSTVCTGYLSRVFLTMEEWELAANHADLIVAPENLDNHQYRLADNFGTGDEEEPFTKMWIDDFSSELMLVYLFTSTSVSGAPGTMYINDSQGDPIPDYIPADWLLDLYSRGDVRYDVYFRHNVKTGFGELLELVNKYPGNPKFTFNGANMPKPMRMSEMYLIAAEAYAELGDLETAQERLHTLLAARFEEDPYVRQEYVKDYVWYERIRELCFEGHYWYDLKRKGLGFKREKQYYTNNSTNELEIKANDYRWNLPIPTAEINANENIEQNAGYAR